MIDTSTYQSYHVRSAQLLARAVREGGLETKNNLPDAYKLVKWLIALKPQISMSTWRQYKAAVLFALNTHYVCSENVDIDKAKQKLLKESQAGAIKCSRKTSALKIKKFPPDDLMAIYKWLEKSKAQYSEPLKLFLLATITTGLRPVEWQHAQLLTDKIHEPKIRLVVLNAKATDGRGNGKKRTLDLTEVPTFYLDTIQLFLEWVQTKKGRVKWSSVQASLSRHLARANAALWPKRKGSYTLYSCRHQAAANFKCIFSRAEVAALFGHATDESATRYYARSHNGSEFLLPNIGLSLPLPLQNEVASVLPRYLNRMNAAQNAWSAVESSENPPGPSL